MLKMLPKLIMMMTILSQMQDWLAYLYMTLLHLMMMMMMMMMLIQHLVRVKLIWISLMMEIILYDNIKLCIFVAIFWLLGIFNYVLL